MADEEFMDFPFSGTGPGQDISGPLSIAFEATLVFANIFPICIVCKYKHPKTRLATDELIMALSITDILSVLIPSPLGLISYFSRGWYGGKPTCDFYQLAIAWFQLTSMCLVTFMCLERWISLKDAMLYKTPSCKHRRTRLAVLAIYIFTLTVSCLPLFGLAPQALSTSGKLCQAWLISEPASAAERVFYFVFLTVGFSNLLATVVINSTVVATLWQFQKKFGSKPAERMSTAAMQIDKRTVVELTVMILIVTVVFYLAWLPALHNDPAENIPAVVTQSFFYLTCLSFILFKIMVMLKRFGVSVSDAAVMYSLLSTTLTGLINPLIYGVFSRSYRRGYTRIIVATSKLLFGCPISQEDVINDISSQARRMRAAGSTTTSMAALLNRCSETTPEAGSSHPSQLVIGTPSDCVSSNADGHQSLLSTPSNPHCRLHCQSGNHTACADAVDMHERTYIDEIMQQRDSSNLTNMSRDMYGSSLSLISEDSAGDMSVSSDSMDYQPPPHHHHHHHGQSAGCPRHPAIVQESMI